MADLDLAPDTIGPEELTGVVRRILQSETAELIAWEQRPLEHRALWQHIGGLYRFSGRAQVGEIEQPWSVILKIVRRSTDPSVLYAADLEPGTPNYWKREPELFRDGILDSVDGNFIPPRCYGVVEPNEATAWIWLEEIIEADALAWSLARYGVAARHLGQFNGRYLEGKAIPMHSAFCPSQLRTSTAIQRERGQGLPPSTVWDEPAVRAAVSTVDARRFARLWAEQGRFLDVLEQLPRTFCHRDAFRNNLLARRSHDGKVQTVAIDWALAGPGHLGEDLFKFVQISEASMRAECNPRELDEIAFDQYLAGLRDVGWTGDERLVRLGYAATVVMFAAAGFLMVALRSPELMERMEWLTGKPSEEIRSRLIDVSFYTLDLADEARNLMAQLRL